MVSLNVELTFTQMVDRMREARQLRANRREWTRRTAPEPKARRRFARSANRRRHPRPAV